MVLRFMMELQKHLGEVLRHADVEEAVVQPCTRDGVECTREVQGEAQTTVTRQGNEATVSVIDGALTALCQILGLPEVGVHAEQSIQRAPTGRVSELWPGLQGALQVGSQLLAESGADRLGQGVDEADWPEPVRPAAVLTGLRQPAKLGVLE